MKFELEEPPSKRWQEKIGPIYLKSLKTLVNVALQCQKLFFRLKPITLDNKNLLLQIAFLFVLTLIPWISEASVNEQIYSDLKKYSEPVDPLKTGQFVQMMSKYTPGLEVKAQDVALTLMTKESADYTLSQQLAVNSTQDIPEPTRQDATYVVQPGESITQIAQKFNLHVASILDANGIKPEDANKIKQGTILAIPSSDTSSSDEWLIAIQKAQEEQRAADEAKRQAQLKKTKTLAASSKQTASAYDNVDRSNLIVPISSRGISQYFGRGHTGIDYMAGTGTPIRAAAGGKVIIVSTGWSGGYGNQVVVDHGGGRATRYAHLSSISVYVGQTVSQGQNIGGCGSTGRSTGPHLHFELIIGGRPVSPF